jgi:hypothetical protein
MATNLQIPRSFGVEMSFNNRIGFSIFYSRTPNAPNATFEILYPMNNDNHYYSIETYTPINTTVHDESVRKQSGRIVNTIHWAYTDKQLKYNQIIIPIIKVTPKQFLPATKTWSFIPIVERNPTTQVQPVQVPPVQLPPVQLPPVQLAKIVIKEIPNHAISMLLLAAVIQEEECPISGNPIDTNNGSVTSCFHLFDKDALATWLALPHTNKKCPVCMQPCDLYSLS